MNINRFLKDIFFTGILILCSYLLFNALIPSAASRLNVDTPKMAVAKKMPKLNLVALGDSLTQGVGDETKRGGFVPILADKLEHDFSVSQVEVENYGVSGNVSTQVLKRVKEEEKIQNNLKTADIITLTVGGNDLMRVIQKNILGLSVKTFEKPGEKYQKNVHALLDEIRLYNSKAPIYLLGIYNPFYVYFPEITEMQTIVNDWNDRTQEVAETAEKTYFVPINDLIYQGVLEENSAVDAEIAQNNETSKLNDLRNNALYEEDKFHPNYNGYQIISLAFSEKITETSDDWLTEDSMDGK